MDNKTNEMKLVQIATLLSVATDKIEISNLFNTLLDVVETMKWDSKYYLSDIIVMDNE